MKNFLTWIVTVLLFLAISGGINPLSAQSNDATYKVYDTREGKEVELPVIMDAMQNYDVLFFGEEHNDSVAHQLEEMLLELMFLEFGKNTALSLEMFDRDVQTVMNEYLGGYIREKNFMKDARSWSNYKDYRPMIEFAKSKKLDVICANAPSRYTNLAGRKGQEALQSISEEGKYFFAPLPYRIAEGPYHEKLLALTGHTDVPDSVKKKMPAAMGEFDLITAQSLWDATMAWSIADYLKDHRRKKILQVNGRFHSDERFAIVQQLEHYNQDIRALVISSGADPDYPNIDWNKHKHLGDFVIITDPKVPRSYEQ